MAVPAAADPGTGTTTRAPVTAPLPEPGPDSVDDRYIVLLAGDPVASYDGGVAGLSATAPQDGDRIDADSAQVQQYVEHLEGEQRDILADAGVDRDQLTAQYAFAVNGFAAELTQAQVSQLATQPDVAAIRHDELQQVQTDNSPQFLGLSQPGGPWSQGYDGEGVVVSVIDTGIWPELDSFADDGTLPGPPPQTHNVPCEFGNPASSAQDAEFECNDKLVGARDMRATYKAVYGAEAYDSARDGDGHGTHTASTAAGNRGVDAVIRGISRGEISGVAPRAHVLAYKACGEQGCLSSDLLAGINQSVADGADVINYSLGSGAGPVGLTDLAFLFAAQAGVFVATSAGNSGPAPATIGRPGVWPWLTTVGASTEDRTFRGAVTLGNGQTYAGASITGGVGPEPIVDAADAGSELCVPGELDPDIVAGDIVLCRRGSIARVEKSRAVLEAGGVGMILYDVTDDAALVTDTHWVPSVHVPLTEGLAVKGYIEAAGADATATVERGEKVRAQGSVMADFSSRGPDPMASDIIKPDVTAPGVNIMAGFTPTPALEPPGDLFAVLSGTSMSSPHVAGMFALLKQAHPDWSPAVAKSATMTTARQDVTKEDGGTPADPFDMGAGHIVPSTVGEQNEGVGNSAFDPGLAYDVDFVDYLGFLCGADQAAVFVNPEGTCASLEAAGVATDPSDLNLASIGIAELAGSQTVTRTVTNVSEEAVPATYRATVDAPRGFRVRVSPSVLTLRPGESATYQVTVTRQANADEDVWSFGSLTWSGLAWDVGRGRGNRGVHRHDVRSPIAVRAVALSAPDEVGGTGTSGTASFPVTFGYTGDYEARAHGLVPPTHTEGSVGQDPDQTFVPTDPQGVTAHEFVIKGAALARWRLTDPSPGLDLDVYVYNSAGEQVAASTNGGTDELIDLRLPPDDTYTVYVHGWQAGGEVVDYDLESWVVPVATDGSLSITDAPTAARSAATGTVEVGWDGLQPAGDYLGAVSHNRGDERLALTLVEVATQ